MEIINQEHRTILELTDQDVNLEIWIEAFLKDRKASGLANGTVGYYREKLAYFVKFCRGRYINQITQISPTDIRDYLLLLEEQNHNKGGQHSCYRALRAFLYWWERELEPPGWRNPIRKVNAPKVAIEPLEPASKETIEAILETCKNNYYGLRDKAIILVLMDTGVRASELLSINLGDVDSVMGSVLIRHGKGGKPRTVFFGKTTRKALRAYLRKIKTDSPDLFLWKMRTGERMTYSALRMMLKRRAELAGVETPTPHSFRRLFALTMLRAGVDIYSLQLLMGHADLSILRRYLKQTDGDLLAAHIKGSPVDAFY